MSDYIYHYTSLESLALILKNRTFRLSSLANMDDLEEGETSDIGKFGRYTYVSSWTAESEESIPLWNLYTPNMAGVRIRMKRNIFDTEIKEKDENIQKEDIEYSKGLLELQNQNNVIFMPYKAELIEVTYTNDRSLLYPQATNSVENGDNLSFSVNRSGIGKFKRKVWEFQKELRYRIHSLPFSMRELESFQLENKIKDLVHEWIYVRKNLAYVDLHIAREAFEDMEILCGPKTSYAQITIIEDLVEKYNPEATIQKSSLLIR
ncbi:DUF2971 domain-containing protein [Lysinibacillus xylanilyticus]|uniref:DUF2971 domain-containing protein n=1 Tax=Lysinibacillus xylanilyticus TaxID=582475 RepID=UPI00083CA092|nr:DUF2971 domain-containing protein [Lysinibacillus xylanilyticus]